MQYGHSDDSEAGEQAVPVASYGRVSGKGRDASFAWPSGGKTRRIAQRRGGRDGLIGVIARSGQIMGKAVLVTGAGGFIGSHLAERLVRDGHRVRVLVRYNGRDDRGHLDDLPADVQAELEVHRGRPERPRSGAHRPSRAEQWVFHLGALIAIPYSYQNPHDVVQTNVTGHRPCSRCLPGLEHARAAWS